MDPRTKQLIDALPREATVTSSELARQLGVSDRTVRSYVTRANTELAGVARIERSYGKGYRLAVLDEDALAQLTADELAGIAPAALADAEDRAQYLLQDLLNRSGWITIDQLARIMHVSRSTVSEDLKEVKRTLARFGMSLEHRPYHGIRIVGTELERRLCLADLTLDRTRVVSDVTGEALQQVLAEVATCVDAELTASGMAINSAAYQNLLVHIVVTIARLRDHHQVQLGEAYVEQLRPTPAFAVAERIARALEEHFNLELPEDEVAYIAVHLAGKQVVGSADGDADGAAIIPDEVWGLVSRLLEQVWKVFQFDFRSDLELRMNLARHLVPLSVRLRFHLPLANPLLTDIKARFPLAYSLALEGAGVLADAYQATLSDDEVGYLALDFALALDRQKDGHAARKNILIVCATGAGSSRLIEHRFRDEFGSRLGTVETCDVQGVETRDLTGIDYVFTTVPIARQLPVPVQMVSAFLDDQEIPQVRAALRSVPTGDLERFFDPELFFAHRTFATREDVIAFLCHEIEARYEVTQPLEPLVLAREQAGYTSFGNRVAMPHPIDPVTEVSVVAVALLDAPVDWGGKPVQAVFLISLSRHKDKGLQPFYRAAARLFGSEQAIDTLISQQRLDVLLEQLHAVNP